MKTLAETLEETGDHVETLETGAKVVFTAPKARERYYGLADYAVSSACSRGLVLTPRVSTNWAIYQ